jgi:murein DD-endopeptidase MepM/ murein hydrolase activator NlpD
MDTGWGAREDAPRAPGGGTPPGGGSGRRTLGLAVLVTLATIATGLTLARPASAATLDHAVGTITTPTGHRTGRQVAATLVERRARPARTTHNGTDQHTGRKNRREERAERDIALASTWHLDPDLLAPLPTDSSTTTAAREALAAVGDRLQEALDAYDLARTAADDAHASARAAREELQRARAAERRAAARWRADKKLLMSVFTEAYTNSQVGALGLLLSADSDEDLVAGVTVLQEMGRQQTDAVEAADRSRDRLREAAEVVAEAEERARDELADARAALAVAAVARNRVLTDFRGARSLLEDSVLADHELRDSAADGYDGAISFPLPPSASFVDQHNFGRRSKHWATVHTGDDLSTACGTPVRAVTDGTVLVRTDQTWSGRWLVMVSTGAGRLTTWYAHMQALLVQPGEQVRAGQTIGLVGQGGNATGCHLHLELHPSGGSIYADDTDPSAWLTQMGAYPA